MLRKRRTDAINLGLLHRIDQLDIEMLSYFLLRIRKNTFRPNIST